MPRYNVPNDWGQGDEAGRIVSAAAAPPEPQAAAVPPVAQVRTPVAPPQRPGRSVPPEPVPIPRPTSSGTVASHAVRQDAVLFVRGILSEGIKRGASDIHFEPRTDSYRIRFRVDGVLQDYTTRPEAEYSAVLNTIKVLADVDIAEHTLPLDGHIELAFQQISDPAAGQDPTMPGAQVGAEQERTNFFDIRVSTFPSVNGEVVVMRVLNRSDAMLSIEELGMDIASLELLREILVASFGMVLVTGPTGSGKTTTLYSILRELKSGEKNMVTLEDPIEFHLDWMRQCEIRESRGFTYERAMAAVLRQDPDVLMVGEIRDSQTAEYAVRSALVGHLVGSTIHANTATGTIARLLDLGIPRSILAHSLNGVIAQRLVRKICEHCKEEYMPPMFYLHHFGLQDTSGPYYRGKGCDKCHGSGFKGRMGIFSVMMITDPLRSLIFEQRSLVEIQQYAIDHGMKTLKMDAASKVLKGITTAEEAARVI